MPSPTAPSRALSLALAGSLALVGACQEAGPMAPPQGTCEELPGALRPTPRPVEAVALSLELPLDEEELKGFLRATFGDEVKEGAGHDHTVVSPGVTLTVREDDRTPEQVVLSVEMTPPTTHDDAEPRLVTEVPGSFALGSLWIDAVEAALARAAELRAEGETELAPWNLDYRARSANGGALTLSVRSDAAGRTTLLVETAGPHTSLLPGQVNQPALVGKPYETVGGTVWFALGRDEFDFFASRAYGVSAGAAQNFRDFQLQPHNWLRITVTPQYALEVVDVAFEIVTVDGRRVNLARSPASYVAGEQFHQSVLRMIDDMEAREAASPGSGGRFTTRFDYEDSDGGGIVKVIVVGDASGTRVAYEVESPVSFLEDVSFVPFVGEVELPDSPPDLSTCPEEERADSGRFLVTFLPSSTVRDSRELKAPLVGDVYGSVFRSEDVTIMGPNEGAEPVASFHFADVDVRDAALARQYEIATDLPAGDYQVLGFMDIDDTANPDDASPDAGDPVMIPIGGYKLECALQAITVEFAILLPDDY